MISAMKNSFCVILTVYINSNRRNERNLMPKPKYVCSSCSYKEKPMTWRPGSVKLEIVLWICGIIPGLLYTIWRNYRSVLVCPNCETATMISTKTSYGQRLSGF